MGHVGHFKPTHMFHPSSRQVAPRWTLTKEKIPLRGGLYGTFEDAEGLRGLLRVSLSKELQELLIQYKGDDVQKEETVNAKIENENPSCELGLLDALLKSLVAIIAP
jgi:hypothetical protein